MLGYDTELLHNLKISDKIINKELYNNILKNTQHETLPSETFPYRKADTSTNDWKIIFKNLRKYGRENYVVFDIKEGKTFYPYYMDLYNIRHTRLKIKPTKTVIVNMKTEGILIL